MNAHLDQTARKTHEVGRGAERSAERLILMLVPTVTAALTLSWLLWLLH